MPEAYYELLEPLCRSLDIWETEYQHILSGDDPVLNWVRGAALCQVISTLSEAEYADFERAYARRLREAYPKLDNGKTLFVFRRLFLVAYTYSWLSLSWRFQRGHDNASALSECGGIL